MRSKGFPTAVLAVMLVVSSALAQAPAPAPSTSTPQHSGSKFWLGRQAEIEPYLVEAEVVRAVEIPVGVTKPLRLFLTPGGPAGSVLWSALHGRVRGYWDSWKADVAAYEVDKLLGLDMVPPVVPKRYQGKLGRASMWVPDCTVWKIDEPVKGPDKAAWTREVVRMKMFDNLIGNTDRNQGNLLIDPTYNLILIDHTRAFTAGKKLVSTMSRIDPDLWDRMQALSKEQLEPLEEWLTKGQIKRILERRQTMAKTIEKLVERTHSRAVFLPRLGSSPPPQ
jgi:hypothetical protein